MTPDESVRGSRSAYVLGALACAACVLGWLASVAGGAWLESRGARP